MINARQHRVDHLERRKLAPTVPSCQLDSRIEMEFIHIFQSASGSSSFVLF